MKIQEKPKAFIDKKIDSCVSLMNMLQSHPNLYEQILDTPGFAYHFSQLTNRAVHYDYITTQLLPDYEKNLK